MRCVCVYCGILYNVKEPFENDSETHGNCDECDRMEKHNLQIRIADCGLRNLPAAGQNPKRGS